MKNTEKQPASVSQTNKPDNDFPGYPQYPPSEDIYAMGKKEADIDPENPTTNKAADVIESRETPNEKAFKDDVSGSDLDIPGTELDDSLEAVGSEDEENNYYSIGGDNHNDLEEDQQ
ncbi:MAG TPA: hypothetical protein PLS51_12285 [Flavobacterium sp.]|jgi:hypothetical protein|nr:hypothetical protein [Flavobacterium sp.]HPJ11405.1 hypothetical protein [Flavobacterium sp.]